jgi:chromosome partitioning protein
MIPNTILITNGKGGVGKTSLAANLGGLAAFFGWRTLLVDTDPQGNLARDLGVIDDTDDGANLADAILNRAVLAPMRAVRENLDLAPGGHLLESVPAEIQALMARGQYLSAIGRLETAISPHAGRYDVIVIDSPPGERALQTLAARAAHYLVIPTAPDDCSIDGLANVFDRYNNLRTDGGNPDLEILGVALTLTVTNAHAVRRRARQTLAELLGNQTTVFDHTVRFAQAAATDCRRTGRLAHEYEADAAAASPWWQHRDDTTQPVYSGAATGLAEDYHALTNEILTTYAQQASSAPMLEKQIA